MMNEGVKIRLLPPVFGKIGWGMLVVSGLLYIYCSSFLWDAKYLPQYILFIKSISVLAFYFVMSAKGKEEDERSMFLRIKTFAVLFLGLLITYVISNLQIVAHGFIGHTFNIDFNYFIFFLAFVLFLATRRQQRKEDNELDKN